MVLLRITVIHCQSPLGGGGGGGGVVLGSGTAERGSTGTDFSHLRPCLNGGASGRGASGGNPPEQLNYTRVCCKMERSGWSTAQEKV